MDRHIELGRKLLTAERAVVGEQKHALPIRFEPPDAGQEALEVIGELVPRHRAGAVIVVDDLRLAVACQRQRPPCDIDRQAARDRHHPGKWRRLRRIELPCAAPDLQIGVLHDIGRKIFAAHDAQNHAIELGAGRAIKALERDRVTLGDGGEQPRNFNRRRHQFLENAFSNNLRRACDPEGNPGRRLWPPMRPVVEARIASSGPLTRLAIVWNSAARDERRTAAEAVVPWSDRLDCAPYARARLPMEPTAASSAGTGTSSSRRSRIWSRSSSISAFFISSKASPSAALASSS